MTQKLEVEIGGEVLWLLPEKAIYWPAQKSLLIADTHFGKITHFRKAGIALPDTAAFENLRNFKRLIEIYRPNAVYFLGDLFHSELNTEWFGLREVLTQFLHITLHLVEGNHDILDENSYTRLGFTMHMEPLVLGPFVFSHEPMESEIPDGRINVCGHIHPGVRLRGSARQTMRLPCFFLKPNQLIMPAFGAFTGLYTLKPTKKEQVFVCVNNSVMEVS
jgi:DNA ligase-associated metallophosphoesterase